MKAAVGKSFHSRKDRSATSNGRFDRNLAQILEHAIDVFYEKGYEGASMRELSRATGMSLAGLYYYFESKERLLYLIQKHTFTTIVSRLRERLNAARDPEQRIRIFVLNHLQYSIENEKAMKVLSHEDEALKNTLGAEVAAIKHEYYRLCLGLLDDFKRERNATFQSRVAVLSLFGMLNWIYTWYKRGIDPGPSHLAEQMADIFLHGLAESQGRHMTSRRKHVLALTRNPKQCAPRQLART
jgi:TetR/AcrR family transcriptional regulator, cholesterol catabolism regulator